MIRIFGLYLLILQLVGRRDNQIDGFTLCSTTSNLHRNHENFHSRRRPTMIKTSHYMKNIEIDNESPMTIHSKGPTTTVSVDESTARLALEKLRDRQARELAETERMLEIFVTNHKDKMNHIVSGNSTFSTATSVLAGTDYGFISRSEGPPPTLKGALAIMSENYGPPSNILTLGSQQFMRNWRAILGEYSDEPSITFTARQLELQQKLMQLTLNSTEIWERERANGPIDAPLIIKVPYLAICYLLDVLFEGKYVPARFFLLETVARMPYFSYISMLHLYETLGFWRRSADAKRIHFAEELNEFAHLMIMESLGGDQSWWVRFVAQHSAIVYYFVLCGLFAISPSLSYQFSELLETHAVNTYSVFLDNNEKLLKELPPSKVAVNYYSLGLSDPFYAEFQASSIVGHEIRRPGERMKNLYDVFAAISADESDHASAMASCLDTKVTLKSPSIERRLLAGLVVAAMASYLVSMSGTFDGSTLLDTTDTITDAVATTATDSSIVAEVAAATAGITSWVEEMAQEDTENIKSVSEGLVEGSNLSRDLLYGNLRRFADELIKILSRFL